jgi:outer membrane murein-binding lipoprotein Lpp
MRKIHLGVRSLRLAASVLILLFLAGCAVAVDPTAEMNELIKALRKIAAALAILLIAVQGLKYVTAESPDDRAEAKKGLIWIIAGLLIAAIAANLVCGLYCAAIASAYGGFTCSTPTVADPICHIT